MAAFKVLRLLAILVVMFTALVICAPTLDLHERHKVRATPVMNVPAPGPGPRAIKSTQNVSWWCNACSSSDTVTIQIIKKGVSSPVFTTTGQNANSGSKDFFVDPAWASDGDAFTVKVTDDKNHASGTSSQFTVFKTKE
ncbi:3251_t:CDS:2 [Paraglomus occultum]|uniref:3251_t:CDS:1 n=1 Tax=Paraglomus occultum TaxID=144539 RepID=A0A9N9CFJ9_9GLOM|nr:3251_t:CDS:2 [Paraglomus occultum]